MFLGSASPPTSADCGKIPLRTIPSLTCRAPRKRSAGVGRQPVCGVHLDELAGFPGTAPGYHVASTWRTPLIVGVDLNLGLVGSLLGPAGLFQIRVKLDRFDGNSSGILHTNFLYIIRCDYAHI